MRSVIFIALFIFSISYAHDGHDDHNAPGTIENGKLKAKDNVTYFDAGAEVQWLGQKLKRKITSNNQIVYQYSDGSKEASPLTSEQDKYLTLKVPGGKVFGPFLHLPLQHFGRRLSRALVKEIGKLVEIDGRKIKKFAEIIARRDWRIDGGSSHGLVN